MKHFFTICALLALSNAMGQTPEYVPTSGLVSWWNLNGDAIDEVGGNDGIQYGTSPTSNRQGQEGQALGFDGDDYVSLDTFFGGVQMTEASYSLWFNSTDNGGTQFISGKEGYWRTIYVRLTADGVIRFGGTSGGVYFGVSTEEDAFEFGTWNHLVVNFIDSQITLYLNGAEVISGPSTTSFLDYQFYAAGNSTATNYLGAIHPVSAGITNHFVGSLDEFGLWNRALDQEEIEALFNSTNSNVACTDPEACNYNSFAVEDDGSCAYPAYGQDCNGDCAGGTAWHVDGNASEADATGEEVAPFATIQAAANVACEGDTIFVAPGVYLENVNLTQSHVVLTGYAYSEVTEPIAEQVIIDGGELGTTLFISGEYTELAHLTIQNGRSSYGAGLYLAGSDNSWIHDCVIRDNVGTGDITAHGIQLGASHCVVEDCLVTGNYGRKHTINAGGSDNVIRNCRIVDNTAWETGGGIVAYTDRMLIENCLIANNEGGGITTYNDNTVVDHCTVTGNGGFGFFIWCLDDADMYVSNTVASGNGSTEVKIQQTGNQVGTFHVRNSLIEGGVDYEWTSVYKVIDSDASLLELSPNLTGDFTLSSISPAIGHGTDFRYDFDGLLEGEGSVEDLSGDARPQPSGTMPDLGCFEHPLGMPEPTFGCTDSSACNYEAGVTDDDGSCMFPTCDDITACNYDPDAFCGGGVCIPSGCLEPEACNFNPNAECEGETCDYTCCPGPGCCDLPAVWDSAAQMCVVVESICGEGTAWDESLQQCFPEDMCFADLDNDGVVGMADLLDLLTQFGSECAE